MRYRLWRGNVPLREQIAKRASSALRLSHTKRLSMTAGVLLLAGAVFIQMLSVRATPSSTNLTAHWAFNEASGTTAADSSGNGFTGTLNSTPTWGTGVAGNALTFDGTDYVAMGRIASVENVSQVTLSAWIKRSVSNGRILIGKQATNHDIAIEAWNDGKVYFQLSNGAWAYGTINLNDTNWHHVALVFDGTQTGNSNRLKGYLDGTAQTLTFTGTVPATTTSNTANFQVGRIVNDYSNGSIDDVWLYTRALSASEVQDVMVTDTTAPTVPTGLSATPVSQTQVNLSWTASTDAVGVTGYKIYRDNVEIATTSGTTYNNTGLTASTTYQYKVAAYDADGNTSAQTSGVNATTQSASDTTAPTTPTGLSATAVSQTQVNLSWTASTDNVGVTGYRIYRDNVQIDTTTGTTYNNTGLTANTTYQYKVAAYDAATNVSAQSSAASATTHAASTWPLQISTDLRRVEDANGNPYLINGDTPWSLFVGPTKEDAEMYLEDRRSKGFNSILVNLIEHHFNGPTNAYNEDPFTVEDDFTAPNEDYFDHVDWVMDKATELGFTVFLNPAYIGINATEGWEQEILAAGPTDMATYGTYVGNRYKDYDNIVWVMGGDSGPYGMFDEIRAMQDAIATVDTDSAVWTAHNSRYQSAVTEYDDSVDTWLNLNNAYADCFETPAYAIADYQRSGPIPYYYIEGKYEGESASEGCIRAQTYWPVLLGATGSFFGNNPIWMFDAGWENELDSQGAQDQERANELFLSRDWDELVPDISHSVLTAGYGVDDDGTYAAAARTPDGDTIIVYTPEDRNLTIDMTKISSSTSTARAWWYDPATGATTNLGTYATSGSQVFNPPAAGDWVLVIDDNALSLPAPGTVTTDTIAPKVSVTAPNSGSTVYGASVSLTASAYDNKGVAGVQFKVNGSNVGSEDTVAPYAYTWNSTAVSDGSYTVTAVARDAANNTRTSKTVTITVNNSNPPTGPIAAYGFNNSSTPLVDNSGNSNTLSCPSGACPTYSSSGGHSSSGAYNFAGDDNWLTVPNESQFDFTSNFSVSLWMKTSAWVYGWETFVAKGDSAWAVGRHGAYDKATFTTYGPGANDLSGSTALAGGTWHHVAVVYDGSTKKLYVDGVLDASASYTSTISTNSLNVRLGYNEEYTPADFEGYMDDVRIYNRAISQSEVQSDMATAVN